MLNNPYQQLVMDSQKEGVKTEIKKPYDYPVQKANEKKSEKRLHSYPYLEKLS